MFSLEGKKAFITGGASGIGLAVATHFIESGANVVIADIHNGQGAVDRIGAQFIEMNVSDENQVADALDRTEQMIGRLKNRAKRVWEYKTSKGQIVGSLVAAQFWT